MLEFIYQISFNWFLLYYFSLGLILVYQGIVWWTRPGPFTGYLTVHAKRGERPALIIKSIRYLFTFTALSFVLAFFPFSFIELIFSVWCFLMLFILSSLFVKWDQLSKIILDKPNNIEAQVRKGGAMSLSLGVVMFLLAYLLLTSA